MKVDQPEAVTRHQRSHGHRHAAPRAVALGPTWSLMRLSALQRLGGAAVIVVVLWGALARLTGWF